MSRAFIVVTMLAVGLAVLSIWIAFHEGDRARRAEAQGKLNAKSATITDKANQNTQRIIVQSETMAHAVETAPGGDAPIPPAVRSGWDASIDGMRNPAKPAHTPQPAR